LILSKLDKQDEKESSFGFQNVPWLFESQWIWGEVRKCEQNVGEELRVCLVQMMIGGGEGF
jgi:hypothetical protein